jgi:hygromycin-B 4-O-kinase
MTEQVIDPAHVDFIRQRFGEQASDLELLSGGDWSTAYAFELNGEAVVVRFGAYGEDFAKDQLMSNHSSERLPVPRVLMRGETSNGYFVISERAVGGFLDDLDEPGMRRMLPSLLTALDAIGDIDVSHTSGYGIWTPDQRAPHVTWPDALLAVRHEKHRVPGWRSTLATSAVGVEPFERFYAKLEELVPALPNDRHIAHSDLLNRNVLVNDGRISAVIDWGNSLYGDHLYDAAWLMYCWQWIPQWQRIDIENELMQHWARHEGVPESARERLIAYQLHIGLESIAYNAFRGRWDYVTRNVEQLDELTG